MNTYLKLYGWMWNIFGSNQFSLKDFSSTFPSPQAKKVIHDMVGGGYVERISRGRYRAKEPEEFISRIVRENLAKGGILDNAEKMYAFCGSDAVSIWTEGYYFAGFTKGYKPTHIEVLEKDLNWWEGFFKKHDIEYVVEGENKTLFGLTYVLHPVKKIISEEKDGINVVPLKDALEFCKKNELTYQPALEYLDERYHLGLFEHHQYIDH